MDEEHVGRQGALGQPDQVPSLIPERSTVAWPPGRRPTSTFSPGAPGSASASVGCVGRRRSRAKRESVNASLPSCTPNTLKRRSAGSTGRVSGAQAQPVSSVPRADRMMGLGSRAYNRPFERWGAATASL